MSFSDLSRENTHISDLQGVPPLRSNTVEPEHFREHRDDSFAPPRIGIAIPPNTPSLGMTQDPQTATPVPIQPPRYDNVPLSSFQLYQQGDGDTNSTSLKNPNRKMNTLSASTSLLPNTSQRLRDSISRPTSPHEAAVSERVSDLSGDTTGRTPIGQRGGRTRAQTLSVPTFAPHVGDSESAEVGNNVMNEGGNEAISGGTGLHLVSKSSLTGSAYPLRHNNNLNTNILSSAEGDRTSATAMNFGRPGFDRNQQTAVFFSPTHYGDSVVMPTEKGDSKTQQHQNFRGSKGVSGPIFSALGAGGSPIFGPNASPVANMPISQLNIDDDDVTPSFCDPLSLSQREGHQSHTNAQEGILSSLTRRRYVLPAKAAAHALTVANDNIAAAGLGNLFGTRQGQSTASSILNMLMGTGTAPSENVGVRDSPIPPAISGGSIKSFPNASLLHQGTVHVVPTGLKLHTEDNKTAGISEDPLQLGGSSGRVSRVPTGKSFSTAADEWPLNQSSSTRNPSNLMSITANNKVASSALQPQTLAAVHKYHRAPVLPPHSPGAPATGRPRVSPALGTGGTFYGAHRNDTAPPSLTMLGGEDVEQQDAQEVSNSELDAIATKGQSPKKVTDAASPIGRRATDAAAGGFSNVAFRYAPLYYNLDTSLSAIQQNQQHRVGSRPSAVSAPPMPSFDPIEGGEDFPDTSDSDAEGTKIFANEHGTADDDGGLHFSLPKKRPSERMMGFGSISAGDDAPPLIVAARKAADSAKKHQRRKERREKPPFVLPPKESPEAAVGVPKAVQFKADQQLPIVDYVRLKTSRILPSIPASIPGVAPIPPTAAEIASLIYTHPLRDPLASLLRNVSPLSVPLTWSLALRREEERYFLLETVRMSRRLGFCGPVEGEDTSAMHMAAHALPRSKKIAALQSLPPPPFLSPKSIASEVILDAPASHGLFASFERSGTLLELARFCRSYPDALHFLEKVLQEADDPMSASNKAIAFKKTSLAKDIIESKERRRQRRMEKKGRCDDFASGLDLPNTSSGNSSSSMNSSDDEGSDLEDLMLNNLGTNLSYQMDVVLPLFPQLEDVVTLLKASCQTIRPEDSEEYKRDIEAATFTVDRLITALDPALHAEPSLSWPFHVLCSLACFFVTALKVGFVPLLKSLRKGSLASSGKGILAALAVSLTCKECLSVDDIAGVDSEASPSNLRQTYSPSDPFHYTNRNSEAEGHFYTDEEHQNHDLTLRKFLALEAENSLLKADSVSGPQSSLSRRILAMRTIRLQYYKERLAEIGAAPSRFCTLVPTVGENSYYVDSVFTEITSPEHLKKSVKTTDRSAACGDAMSFKQLSYLADDYNAFEHTSGVVQGGSDDEEEQLVRTANSLGASIPLLGSKVVNEERKKEEQERRAQIIALQNERCEVIFFKHCVEALRAAQGVGLAFESLRATNGIKPTTLISPDGAIIEPDDDEEEGIALAAESGGESSEDENASKKKRKSSARVSLTQKDAITNANSKCSILLVNVDVTVVRILMTAVNEGLSSWVGVESSIAAAKKHKPHEPSIFGNSREESDLLKEAERRRKATLKSADNPNSATRGATTVVGTIEISRIFCSRSLVVSGHPSDIARFDLMLMQYSAFSGDKIHRDKLPIEAPENNTQYCGDMLQIAITRIWKGVQHGYTYRADHNRLVVQRRRERARARVARRQEWLQARAERHRKRLEMAELRRKERESRALAGHVEHIHADLVCEDSESSTASSDGDAAEDHYYADLAALAVESPLDAGPGVDQDLHDFERATRFYLSFLVHPSELGIDLLHPVSGESMRVIRGGLKENAHPSQSIPARSSAAQDLEKAHLARMTEDAIMGRLYHNNDPSAHYRARYGGGYMNKARLRDAWTFTDDLANGIVSARQNLGASLDTIRQRGASHQRQRASKHAEADTLRYAANKQAAYDTLLRSLNGMNGEDTFSGTVDSLDPTDLFKDPEPAQPTIPGAKDGSVSFSQAAIASSRYGHQKDLLLDFSFSRLRVGEVVLWAQNVTQAGAFVTPNAANSAANDIVVVPQPKDAIDIGTPMLKPPKRGTRGDVVSRTWLQLSIINRALTTHVPRVLVSETTVTKSNKHRSSLITAAERLKQIDAGEDIAFPSQKEEVSRQLVSNNFDVADARLLDRDGTPRVYSINDNFVQYRLLRSVFFHPIDADPNAEIRRLAAKSGLASGLVAPKAAQDIASFAEDGMERSIDVLNALTIQEKVDRIEADAEDSDSEWFADDYALPKPNGTLSTLSQTNAVQTARSKGGLHVDANASPLGGSGSGSNTWAALTTVIPPTRHIHEGIGVGVDETRGGAGGVGNLLCFIDSLGRGGPPTDHITPLDGPSKHAHHVLSPADQLLRSFDNAVATSLPFPLLSPSAKSGLPEHSKDRWKKSHASVSKKSSARRALRSFLDASRTDFSKSLKTLQNARSFHNVFGPECATSFDPLTPSPRANSKVPIIHIDFWGNNVLDGDDNTASTVGGETHERLKALTKSVKRAKEVPRSKAERGIMIACLLSASRYHSWVDEAYDFGANGVARMQRVGVDLAIGPHFSVHLMNVERHQRLSLQRGLRFIRRRQRQLELYAARYLTAHPNDTTAIPAPPTPAPFTKEDLLYEFSCDWVRALQSSSPDVPNPKIGIPSSARDNKIGRKVLNMRPADESVKIAIIEPFSYSSYEMLKAICDYKSAEGLIRAGGGDTLQLGKRAATETCRFESLNRGSKSSTDAPSNEFPESFVQYLKHIFELYIGHVSSDTALDVANVIRELGCGDGVTCKSDAQKSNTHSNFMLDPTLNTGKVDAVALDAVSSLGLGSVESPSPYVEQDKRTTDALKALRNAPPVTVIPLEVAERPQFIAPQDVRVVQTGAARALRQSISGGASGSRGASSDAASDSCCPYCGLAIPNARALRIHSSYCEGTTSNGPSPGVTPATSPQLQNQGTPLDQAVNRNTPLFNNGTAGNVLGTVITRTNSLSRQRTNSQLASPTANADRDSNSHGTGPSGEVEFGSRSVSAGSHANAMKRLDSQEGTFFQRTLSDVSQPPQNLRQEGHTLSKADVGVSADSSAVIGSIRQATVLHALLMGSGGASFEGCDGTGMSPMSPNPPTNGRAAAKNADNCGGGRATVLTTSQSESMTVIDSSAAQAVYGSAALRDTGQVLGGYQFLISNPTLKNEADAVVLDLLQYIESLRSTLLVKQEQLYQQALVACSHLQHLRGVLLQTQTLSLPMDVLTNAARSLDTTRNTPSPQTPQSPGDGVAGPVNMLLKSPHVHIVLLTHHIRELLNAVEGCKRRRDALHEVAANYHKVKTGVMLTPQALQFAENLSRLTDLPFPAFTLLICPTVLQLLDFWDVMEFTTFYCGN